MLLLVAVLLVAVSMDHLNPNLPSSSPRVRCPQALFCALASRPTKCKPRWDGVSLQNAVVALLVKCALNSK